MRLRRNDKQHISNLTRSKNVQKKVDDGAYENFKRKEDSGNYFKTEESQEMM